VTKQICCRDVSPFLNTDTIALGGAAFPVAGFDRRHEVWDLGDQSLGAQLEGYIEQGFLRGFRKGIKFR